MWDLYEESWAVRLLHTHICCVTKTDTQGRQPAELWHVQKMESSQTRGEADISHSAGLFVLFLFFVFKWQQTNSITCELSLTILVRWHITQTLNHTHVTLGESYNLMNLNKLFIFAFFPLKEVYIQIIIIKWISDLVSPPLRITWSTVSAANPTITTENSLLEKISWQARNHLSNLCFYFLKVFKCSYVIKMLSVPSPSVMSLLSFIIVLSLSPSNHLF